ncbi:hypothetical protein AOL_s00078g484 [Orbilia oligospora ATCC 24927]|uniref:Extracellular membrane protein CFEM domain-containing protein n=1 Tax=Arthrobotrys oligospora (strain ATCC 24927 / CBS 115.81 / DSM 1491) TaxID=756982 RepID=G1XC37_ARTOA|nr:hypothetical protein AOL_s00078g484 [Orbilia oligospora ATCC 24927]EGX49451.1 hypothetical protein AOL_s00078g484 [Orbilia oligospora ATCC 24927]
MLAILFSLLLATLTLPSIRVVAQQVIPDRESVKFGEASDFGAIRDCAVCCFEKQLGCYMGAEITRAVGCSLNSCICSRTDIRLIITSHLQSCVSKSCSAVSGDVSVALSVFGGYCDRYVAAGVDAGTTPTDGGGEVSRETVTETRTIPLSTLTTTLEIATVRVAATTITVKPEERLPGSQPSDTVTVTVGSSGGLSESAKIGLGVGLGIGIPIFAVSAFLAYRFTRALTAPPEMPQPIQGSYIG